MKRRVWLECSLVDLIDATMPFICVVATARAQKSVRCDLGVCYDEGSGQCVDIYYPSSDSRNCCSAPGELCGMAS